MAVPLRVLGLGDPVMDIVACVSHEYLARVTTEPGGCVAVPGDTMAALLSDTAAVCELKR